MFVPIIGTPCFANKLPLEIPEMSYFSLSKVKLCGILFCVLTLCTFFLIVKPQFRAEFCLPPPIQQISGITRVFHLPWDCHKTIPHPLAIFLSYPLMWDLKFSVFFLQPMTHQATFSPSLQPIFLQVFKIHLRNFSQSIILSAKCIPLANSSVSRLHLA